MGSGISTQRSFRHITLGRSWETSTAKKRAEFLQELETDNEHGGVWFEGAASADDDGNGDGGNDQLVIDTLAAIRRNEHYTGFCFENMHDKIPFKWLAGMLMANRVEELRIMTGNDIDEVDDAALLATGLKTTESLKTLCLDYPASLAMIVLNVALDDGTLKLETLDIVGFPYYGYDALAPVLGQCTELKELILSAGSTVNLDANIDEFVQGIDGLPLLEKFIFGFGASTTQALGKLLNVLAAKDLKRCGFGPSKGRVILDDATPLERLLTANQNLEFLNVHNVGARDMSEVFGSLNHAKLKEISLYNVIQTAQDAGHFATALSRNNTLVESLDIHCAQEDDFEHEVFLPALSNGLRNSTSLTRVTLVLAQVHNEDLRALSTVVEENHGLTDLSVSSHSSKGDQPEDNLDDGVICLGQALTRNQGVTYLHLGWDQTVGKHAIRAFLNAVKMNSTLKWATASFLSSSEKEELDFYVRLNDGAKQSLHVPLNIMSFAFVRANRCRIKWNKKVDPPSELFFFVRERCDLFQVAAAVARRNVNQVQGELEGDEQSLE